MRKLKPWMLHKREYNRKRNDSLVPFSATVDIDTYNKAKKIMEEKNLSFVKYIEECYRVYKEEYCANEKQ